MSLIFSQGAERAQADHGGQDAVAVAGEVAAAAVGPRAQEDDKESCTCYRYKGACPFFAAGRGAWLLAADIAITANPVR
jgi:hypothetical protein